jgi:hypothetical protein
MEQVYLIAGVCQKTLALTMPEVQAGMLFITLHPIIVTVILTGLKMNLMLHVQMSALGIIITLTIVTKVVAEAGAVATAATALREAVKAKQ